MTIFENIALNNNISNQTSGATKGSGSFAGGRSEVLKDMAIRLFEALEDGDPDAVQVLSAQVKDILQNQITLTLPDSSVISGRTDTLLPLSIGDNATFNVSINKSGQLTLSLVSSDSENASGDNHVAQDDPLVKKALAAANLPVNDRSRQVVSELLNAGQSVSTANIKKFITLSIKNPDIPVKELVLLSANKVPVSSANLTAFKELAAGGTVWAPEALSATATDTQDATSTFVKDQPVSAPAPDLSGAEPETKAESPEVTAKASASLSANETLPEAREDAASQALSSSSSDPGSASLPSGEASEKDVGNEVQAKPDATADKPLSDAANESTPAQPYEADRNSEDQTVAASSLPQPIEPEEFSEEAVKKFYGALKDSDTKNTTRASKEAPPEDQAAVLEKTAEETVSKAAQNAAPAASTADKLQFMQDINNVFPFIQIPVKLQEENAKGELYVFEKKKKYNPDEPLTAVLHLELDSLGTTDIKVTMFKNKVSAHFEVASDDAVTFFEEELPSLTERIEKLGFTFDTDFKVKEPDSSEKPLLYELLEAHAPQNYSRYTFDVHA